VTADGIDARSQLRHDIEAVVGSLLTPSVVYASLAIGLNQSVPSLGRCSAIRDLRGGRA